MHVVKALSATLSFAYIASASIPLVDITRRGWSDVEKRTMPAAAPAANGERIVQIVTVSDNNGSLKFFPENIKADIGSVVQFQFYPKNHTITESTFAAPCKPIAANATTPERPGQKSGFVPVAADAQFRPVYNMLVNDTKPMWIFCGQMPHCQKGMAMVINQNDSDPEKTLEKYKAAAAQLPVPSAPAGAPAPPAAGAGASSTTAGAGVSTVTPPGGAQNTAGPSIVGTTTTPAAAQTQSSTGIATFTGAARPARDMPAAAMLAAGAAWAFW